MHCGPLYYSFNTNIMSNKRLRGQFASCQSIMPYFLWYYIVEYLDVKSMLKIGNDAKLGVIIRDNDWKFRFMTKRSCAIAIVRLRSLWIDGFWKYACYNHIGCNSLHDMFNKIETENKAASGFVYYKIFIDAGTYNINRSVGKEYHFDHIPCSIEIIGTNTIFNFTDSFDTRYIYLYVSWSFMMHHITFNNFKLAYLSKNYNNRSELVITNCAFNTETPDMHMYGSAFDIGNYDTEFMYNCVSTNYTFLHLISITKVTVARCIFANTFRTRVESYKRNALHKIDYTISQNNFTKANFMSIFIAGDKCDKSSTINVTNNIMANSAMLILNSIENASVIIKGNTISNTHICTETGPNSKSITIFEANAFNNVKMLRHTQNGTAILCASNTFINCGTDLTDHINLII